MSTQKWYTDYRVENDGQKNFLLLAKYAYTAFSAFFVHVCN